MVFKNQYLKYFKLSTFKSRKIGKNFLITIARTVISLFIPSTAFMNKKLNKVYKNTSPGNEVVGGYSIGRELTPYDTLKKIEFGGSFYYCFSKPEEYLSRVYGPNFMTPIKEERYKGHVVEEYFTL